MVLSGARRPGVGLQLLLFVSLTIPFAASTQVQAAAVTIAAPFNGASVSGTVGIVTRVSSTVAWENIYIDSSRFASSPPYRFRWNSTAFANGIHRISAKAFGPGRVLLGSAAVKVTVSNKATRRPTPASAVTISSPTDGASVSGTVGIATQVGPSVVWENVYVDGSYLTSSPPYTFTWNSTTVTNGGHTISAKAFGSGSVLLGSAAVTVNVANSATPTPTARPVATPTPTLASTPTSTSTPVATSTGTSSPAPTPMPGSHAYYVDPSGSDSNSGTDPLTPWRTIAKVNATQFQPGDAIYFKRGGIWREMLSPGGGGITGAPMIFAWYGSGAQPIISGSDLITGWSLTSGSIYQAHSAQPGNVFVDGGPGWGLSNASSIGAMTPGSWFWDSSTSMLNVWLADGSNPFGHNVEAAVRVSGFYANTSDNRFSDIVIDGLTFQRTSGYGIYFHSYAGVTGLTGLVIENNTVSQTGTGRADEGQYYNGIFILQEPELPTAPRILNNSISYTGGHGNGINCQGADDAVIEGNDASNWNHNGIDVKNSHGVVVRGNIAHDQPATGAGLYAEFSADITWEQNIVYHASNGIQVSNSTSAAIFNNSIYNCSTGVYFGPSAISVTLENNALNQTDHALESDGSGSIADDYNDWGVNAAFQIGSTAYSFSQWQSQGGRSHEIAVDPQWVNPAAANFSLTAGSACINSGVNVGLPFTGSAPDLGAIESPY
jgi:parallel beta-helix repeat protein